MQSIFKMVTVGSIALAFSAVLLAGGFQAQALPNYAQQTGLACGGCHTNPAGGGALTETGQKFKDNGHKMPDKK